ncbi:MAG: DUF6049 family protein [Actinomycetes bacterium]
MTSTRRRPARGVWRWFSVLLVGLVTTLLLSPSGAVAAPLKTTLQLTSLTPLAPQGEDTLRAKGTFVSNRTLDDVVVRLEIGTTPFVSRSSITEAAANPPFTTPVPGAEDDLRKVRRGEREQFTVAIPAEVLPLAFAGVYPLRVVAVDATSGTVLSSTDTFLPWAPEGVGVPESRLLMFWPMVSPPARDSTGEFVTSTLPASTAAGGRLSTLVESGADAPVTWLVDPALLDAAAALDEPSTEAWIGAFSTAAANREVVALPYGDPDVAAVSAAGRPGFLHLGQRKGDRVYQRVIGKPARSDLSWPADGAGDDRVIATSGRAGDAFVLLNEQNAPQVTPLTYTPSGRIAWEDPALDVLLADGPASALVATPADTTADVLLARQRFLAETLLHTLENSAPRLLVVAPPRRWDPSEQWSDSLVQSIRRAPWLNPVSLDEAVGPEAPTIERVAPSIPQLSQDRQLPASMVIAARRGLTDNRMLAAILTQPQKLSSPIEDALFTSVSTAWRTDVGTAEASQAATLDRLAAQRSRVRIVSRGGTLGDNSGSFPVTVRNQLDQAVVVRLEVTSTDPLRLRVNGPEDRIRVAAGGSVLREVDLDAVTSGRLSFDAQLRTPKGAAYNDPVTLAIDVRGFGQITFVVFGAAVALLVLAAAIRVIRRIRASRRVDA